MSQNQMLPVWLLQAVSLGADAASAAVGLSFEDNVGIQVTWTGTPTGVIAVQISMDPTNLGWHTVVFNPALTQPAGSPGEGYLEINQCTAAFVRMIYTRTSGTGTINAKISLKSV